jgi:hypothetical protein
MEIKIGKNIFKIKLVVSEKEQSLGMMKKRFDETFNGMLFLQGSGHHCFWMKNCITPLDIIFIKDNVITKIHHNCPPLEDDHEDDYENYCGDGDLVLEIQGGTSKQLNIVEGDKLSLLF